jgi:hypothetical protein
MHVGQFAKILEDFEELSKLLMLSVGEDEGVNNIIEKDSALEEFHMLTINTLSIEGIMQCDVASLSKFEWNMEDEEDEEDMIESAGNARQHIFETLMKNVSPFPSVTKVLDERLASSIELVPPEKLSSLKIDYSAELFPKLHEAFSKSIRELTEEEKMTTLFRAVKENDVHTLSQLKNIGFSVRKSNGKEKLFGLGMIDDEKKQRR